MLYRSLGFVINKSGARLSGMAYKIAIVTCLIAAVSAGDLPLQHPAPTADSPPEIQIIAIPKYTSTPVPIQYQAQVPQQGSIYLQQGPPAILQQSASVLQQSAPLLQQQAPIYQQHGPVLQQSLPVNQPSASLYHQAAPLLQQPTSNIQQATLLQQALPLLQQLAPLLQQSSPILQYAVRIAVPQHLNIPPATATPAPTFQHNSHVEQVAPKFVQQEPLIAGIQFAGISPLQYSPAHVTSQIPASPIQILTKAAPQVQLSPAVQYAEEQPAPEDTDAIVAAPIQYAQYAPAPEPPVPVIAKVAKIAKVPKQEHFDHNPEYTYGYDIQDDQTGDTKRQNEERRGDVVQGSYSVDDPDGHRRTVDYTADPVHGFSAVVRREPIHSRGLRPVSRSKKSKVKE